MPYEDFSVSRYEVTQIWAEFHVSNRRSGIAMQSWRKNTLNEKNRCRYETYCMHDCSHVFTYTYIYNIHIISQHHHNFYMLFLFVCPLICWFNLILLKRIRIENFSLKPISGNIGKNEQQQHTINRKYLCRCRGKYVSSRAQPRLNTLRKLHWIK